MEIARPSRCGALPWVGEDTSSFGEQRDNILEAARWCERCFGFVPRSWAKPGRGNDADTAQAAAAATSCSASGGPTSGRATTCCSSRRLTIRAAPTRWS